MKVFVRTQSETDVPALVAMHTRTAPVQSEQDNHVVIADLAESEIQALRDSPHFEVFEDIQFYPAALPVSGGWWERQIGQPLPAVPLPWTTRTQSDVMVHNGASRIWSEATGSGVTIAIVDTGVDGARPDFPNRSPYSYAPSFTTAWEDPAGHGTMCAAVACGSSTSGARHSGVAPDATLLSARSTLKATDLYLIYQHLLKEYNNDSFPGGLVVSNSYALYTCTAPSFSQGHPYLDLVRLCVQAGMVFVFAAGNNHAAGLCNFPADDHGPNTIWAVNSIDEVITVGTVNWDESNQVPGGEHANSSRGPGQWSHRQDKPDLVAPTYGEVAWGGGYQPMEWWGTSGACPQVAGLAALLLQSRPALTPEEIRRTLRATARPLGAPSSCVGAGILDCEAAVRSLSDSGNT